MNVTFRRAEQSDIEVLKAINYSSFQANQSFDPHIDMHWVRTPAAHRYFTEAVTSPDCFVEIAEVNGVSAGYIILEPKIITYRTTKTVEIGIIAVLPEYRSGGIGASLISRARTWATENGYDTIFVNSYIRNEKAVGFYKKQGFSPIDISLELELH